MDHFKQPIFIGAVLLAVVIAAAGFVFLARPPASEQTTATVTRGSIAETIAATGQVKSAQQFDLALSSSGRVASVHGDVGQLVPAGTILVSLENADLTAQLAAARAASEAEQAKLDSLKLGTRPEQLALDRAKVDAAGTAVSDALRSVHDSASAAYRAADDAVRAKADLLFSSPRSSSPHLNIASYSETDIETSRFRIEAVLNTWQSSPGDFSSPSSATASAESIKQNLDLVGSFLDQLALALNSLLPSGPYPQATIDSWKLLLSGARSSVTNASSALSGAIMQLDVAQSNQAVASRALALEQAGATTQDIAAGSARVDAANAAIQNVEALLAKTFIRAPISGTITRQDAKVGQIAAPNVPLVSMISVSQFQIETYLSEADVSRIRSGASAEVTFDAFGPTPFAATVTSVDPAATMANGIPSYRVFLALGDNSDPVKAGMSANITILGAHKEGVLLIPARAVIERAGKTVVLVDTGKSVPEERAVTLGLRTNDMVEIVSGLGEGENVISFGKAQ